MNKAIKFLSVIALAMLLIGLVGAGLTARSYFNTAKGVDILDIREISDSNFSEVEVSADNARIKITATNDEKARVELTGKVQEKHQDRTKLAVTVENDKLKIKQESTYHPWFNINLFDLLHPLEVIVYIPEQQYQSIIAENTNGDVDIKSVKALNLELKSSNGTIKLNDAITKSMKVETYNGSVKLKNIEAESSWLKSSNGRIVLDYVTGQLTGETYNGSITAIVKDMDVPMDLKSNNGSVSIETESEPTNVRFTVSAHNGSTNILDKYSNNSTIGNGDNEIQLSTYNGSIKVKQK